jgi:hypothetical protein
LTVKKPSFEHIRVFGCDSYVHVSKEKKSKHDYKIERYKQQVVSSSNIKDRLTRHMEKPMGTSRKTLHKHKKI